MKPDNLTEAELSDLRELGITLSRIIRAWEATHTPQEHQRLILRYLLEDPEARRET